MVILLCLASASFGAGWNGYATVWPSENYYHLDTPVTVAGLVAQKYTADFYRYTADGTNDLPYSEYTGGFAIAAYADTEQRWTSEWYANIWTHADDATYTGTWVTAEVISTNEYVSGVITVMTERTISSEGVAFGGKFDSLDLVGLEVALAIQERMDALGSDPAEGYGFYREARDNCVAAKSWTAGNYASFYSNAVVGVGTHTNTSLSDFRFNWNSYCAANDDVPTNWASWTPYSGLNGDMETDPGRTMTQTFLIGGGTSVSHVVTNTVTLWNSTFGGLVTNTTTDISGTNGQQFILTVTNYNGASGIEAGHTASDYSYKHIKNVLDTMTATHVTFGSVYFTTQESAWCFGTSIVSYVFLDPCEDHCTFVMPSACTLIITNRNRVLEPRDGGLAAYAASGAGKFGCWVGGSPPEYRCRSDRYRFEYKTKPIVSLVSSNTCTVTPWAWFVRAGSDYSSVDGYAESNWNPLATLDFADALTVTGGVIISTVPTVAYGDRGAQIPSDGRWDWSPYIDAYASWTTVFEYK